MVSNIKDASTQVIHQYQKSELAKAGAEKPMGTAQSVATEKVDISTTAKDIHRAKQAIEALPDIREEKVQELKRQIEADTYSVNTDKLAQKIVGESLIDLFA
jgi:negative regulator of flagellin synthesis FlgM